METRETSDISDLHIHVGNTASQLPWDKLETRIIMIGWAVAMSFPASLTSLTSLPESSCLIGGGASICMEVD